MSSRQSFCPVSILRLGLTVSFSLLPHLGRPLSVHPLHPPIPFEKSTTTTIGRPVFGFIHSVVFSPYRACRHHRQRHKRKRHSSPDRQTPLRNGSIPPAKIVMRRKLRSDPHRIDPTPIGRSVSSRSSGRLRARASWRCLNPRWKAVVRSPRPAGSGCLCGEHLG